MSRAVPAVSIEDRQISNIRLFTVTINVAILNFYSHETVMITPTYFRDAHLENDITSNWPSAYYPRGLNKILSPYNKPNR